MRFPCDNFTICARKVSWNKGLRLNQQTLFSKGLGGSIHVALQTRKERGQGFYITISQFPVSQIVKNINILRFHYVLFCFDFYCTI